MITAVQSDLRHGLIVLMFPLYSPYLSVYDDRGMHILKAMLLHKPMILF